MAESKKKAAGKAGFSDFGAADGPTVKAPAQAAPTSYESLAVQVETLPVHQLIDLRARIEGRLPAKALSEIDLEAEFVLQYHAAQALKLETAADPGTPANQKAQVQNSCNAMLEHLHKMQASIYTTERLKEIEQALIRCVKQLPEEVKTKFFADYESAMKGLSR